MIRKFFIIFSIVAIAFSNWTIGFAQEKASSSDKVITGQIHKSGTPVTNTIFSAHTVGDPQMWYDFTTDGQGYFSGDLPDGTYAIDGVWVDEESSWYELGVSFTVENGALVGMTEVSIDLDKGGIDSGQPSNVLGSVKNGLSPISDVWVSAHTLDGSQWYDAMTDSNGAFEYDMPDGDYKIDGIWVDTEAKWYELNITFSVVNGSLVGSESLNISLSKGGLDNGETGNVSGTVINGSEPVGDVWVSAHTLDGSQWYDAMTDTNGAFEYDMPDGDYQIDGIWVDAESKWYELNVIFSVANGTLVDLQELAIDLKQGGLDTGLNVNGTVQKGNEIVQGVWVSSHTIDGSQWYDAMTNSNGAFGYDMPDGDYKIDGIWVESESKWYELNITYSVMDGMLVGMEKLVIDLNKGGFDTGENVTGTVVNGSNAVPNVWVSAHTIDGSLWYDAMTDGQGSFSYDLPDGNYAIDGIWVDAESKWYELNVTFSVVDGSLAEISELLIDLSKGGLDNGEVGNVSGTVLNGSNAVPNVWVSTHTLDGNHWYDAMTDGQGYFSYDLPNGDYVIDGIWVDAEATWYELNISYSVVDGSLVGMTELTMDLSKGGLDTGEVGNVLGTVVNGEEVVANVAFSTHTLDGTIWYDTQTDDQGKFDLNLPDGDYAIDGIWLESEAVWYELNITYTVNNGSLVELQELNIDLKSGGLTHVIAGNVQGTITDETGGLKNTSIKIWNIDSDENYETVTSDSGEFGIDLPDGSYEVTEVIINDHDSTFVNITFEVMEGKLFKDGIQEDRLTINAPSKSFFGRVVTEDGLPVVYEEVWLLIYSDLGDSLWYMSTTDEDGNYHLRLPNGNYNLEAYWNKYSSHHYVSFAFSIENRELLMNDQKVEVLDITVPNTHISGQIVDGTTSVGEAWVRVWQMSGDYNYYTFYSDENGNFSIALPDGDYNIDMVEVGNNEMYVDVNFTIVNGEIIGEETLMIEVLPVTLSGVVQDNNSILNDAYIIVERTDGNYETYVQWVNENGEFHLRLPDGKYNLTEVLLEENQQWLTLNQSFEIINGTVVGIGVVNETLNIYVPEVKMSGKLVDTTGMPIANAEIELVGNEEVNYIHTGEDGTFNARLYDGSYMLAYIWLEGSSVDVSDIGEITIESGQAFLNGDVISELIIEIPVENIAGKVVSSSGSEVQGQLSIYNKQNNMWYSATSEFNGDFYARLSDGEYFVEGIWIGEEFIRTNVSFSVIEGKLVVEDVEQPVLEILID